MLAHLASLSTNARSALREAWSKGSIEGSLAMVIATDPLSLVFIACFLFGLIFLIASALLGNLGHGGGDSHAAAHHFDFHLGGHAHTAAPGAPHTAGTHIAANHATPHAPVSTHGATAQNQQHALGDNLSVLSYVNPTSVVLFLLGFGFFGYVF